MCVHEKRVGEERERGRGREMELGTEKVYVAIGNDLEEGLATLEWTLRKWSCCSISIVILHAPNSISKDYVYTYYGKIASTYVNDNQLEFLRRDAQEKMEKILHHYITFCGQVKAEIFKIEKHEEPIHKQLVELLTGLHITKLVMGITFMKSSSSKSKSPISGLRYLQQEKPDFCDLFFICGGKLVFLREENENNGVIEDDLGVPLARINKKSRSFKGWLGKKMFPEYGCNGKNPLCSPSSSTSVDSPDIWEKCVEDIDRYFARLLTLKVDQEGDEVADDLYQNSPIDHSLSSNLSPPERIKELEFRIVKARDEIQLKRREARENIERHAKAEWAISLGTSRAEELEGRITEEMSKRSELEKELDTTREELHEIQTEVEQKKSKLISIQELQQELSNKLKSSSLAKSRAEAQLEKTVRKRATMVQEIEKFRRQRDVMQRRIEFCREKDAIEMATTKSNGLNFSFKEFNAQEIRVGTDDFSERLRLKSTGDLSNVYKGRVNRTTVAVKLYNTISAETFQAKVKLLGRIKQPHLVAMLGFCPQLKCIVFEYMHNGCLREALFSNRRHNALNWHDRICVITQVCSGLGFLHQSKPRPLYHGDLSPSKILLDSNNVAKLYGLKGDYCNGDSCIASDIRAFGKLVLQILTGKNWDGINDKALAMDGTGLAKVLDPRAGKWPLELTMEVVRIAKTCLTIENDVNTDLTMGVAIREIEEVRKKADDLVADGECIVPAGGGVDMVDPDIPPSIFLCPIYQEPMTNPYIAEDGFSYELEAIERWLATGHNTSPMTNLQLKNKNLTPNHTLRALIQDWHNKRSIPLEQR